jgi:hypothetical protein
MPAFWARLPRKARVVTSGALCAFLSGLVLALRGT